MADTSTYVFESLAVVIGAPLLFYYAGRFGAMGWAKTMSDLFKQKKRKETKDGS